MSKTEEIKYVSKITDQEKQDIKSLTNLLLNDGYIGGADIIKEFTNHFVRVLISGETYATFTIGYHKKVKLLTSLWVKHHSGKLAKDDEDGRDVYGIYQPDWNKFGVGWTFTTKAGKKFLIDKIQPHINKTIKNIELTYDWQERNYVEGMNIFTTDGHIYVIGYGDDNVVLSRGDSEEKISVAKKKHVFRRGKIRTFFIKI